MSVPGGSIIAARTQYAEILPQAITVTATSDMKEMDSTAPVGPYCLLTDLGMESYPSGRYLPYIPA